MDYFTSDSTFKYCDGKNWIDTTVGPMQVLSSLKDESFSMLNPSAITVSVGHAYIGNSDGLSLFNVTNPQNPNYVTYLKDVMFYDTYEMKILGNYLYVASGNEFITINITTPTAPTISSSFVFSRVKGLIVEAGYVYLSDYDTDTVYIVDVNNPATPSVFEIF